MPIPFIPAQTLPKWLARVAQRTARIGIVGLGYVGLPLTLLLAEDRFTVLGFDTDAAKVEALNAGRSYIHRILPEHIAAAQAVGFRATGNFAEAATLDAILICVPTPLYPDHTPDMRAVVATIEALAPHLRPGQLVVLESTTYPGTTEEIIAATIERAGHAVQRVTPASSSSLPSPIERAGHAVQRVAPASSSSLPSPIERAGHAVQRVTPASSSPIERAGNPVDLHVPNETAPLAGVMVAFSPEREDPGNTTMPRREIPKVVGGMDPAATAAACALYGAVFTRTIAMSTPAAAEMTKLLENIYRSVNIALVNELKQLCLHMGIDIWEVIAAAATKPFGFQAFQPGPGVGGHCIPVDPFYLTWKARQFGFETRFIELAGAMNESMPAYVVRTAERALERQGVPLRGSRVLVIGIAYKRDVDDLRESPALTILELLQRAGAQVAYNDPFFPHVGSGRKYDLRMASTPLSELPHFDCAIIVTDHSTYDYAQIVHDARLVIDSRNATRHIALQDPARVVRC